MRLLILASLTLFGIAFIGHWLWLSWLAWWLG